MYSLSIKCGRCSKTVYGQDWLSGGMCARCLSENDFELVELRKKRKEEHLLNPSEDCICDDCKKHFKNNV